MVLTLPEISALKSAMAEQGIAVHFHNTCGSQYFTLDAIVAAIQAWFAGRPQNRLVFTPDQLGFYILD